MGKRCPGCNSRFLSKADSADRVRCKRCGEVSTLEAAMDHDPYGRA